MMAFIILQYVRYKTWSSLSVHGTHIHDCISLLSPGMVNQTQSNSIQQQKQQQQQQRQFLFTP